MVFLQSSVHVLLLGVVTLGIRHRRCVCMNACVDVCDVLQCFILITCDYCCNVHVPCDQANELAAAAAAAAEAQQSALDQQHGRAVQVDPMKPTLKSPGTKRVETKT